LFKIKINFIIYEHVDLGWKTQKMDVTKKKVGVLTGFHAFVMPGQTDRMEEPLERKNQRSNTI